MTQQQQQALNLLGQMSANQEALVSAIKGIADQIEDTPGEYSIPFRPWLRTGDVVRVNESGSQLFVVVLGSIRMGIHRYDLAVDSASDSTGISLDNLKVGSNAMLQLRCSPMESFELEIDNPPGQEIARTSNTRFRIRPWALDDEMPESSRATHEAMSQFWVYEDTVPVVNARTVGWYVNGYLDVWGWKYYFRKKDSLEGPALAAVNNVIKKGNYRVLQANGLPAQGSPTG